MFNLNNLNPAQIAELKKHPHIEEILALDAFIKAKQGEREKKMAEGDYREARNIASEIIQAGKTLFEKVIPHNIRLNFLLSDFYRIRAICHYHLSDFQSCLADCKDANDYILAGDEAVFNHRRALIAAYQSASELRLGLFLEVQSSTKRLLELLDSIPNLNHAQAKYDSYYKFARAFFSLGQIQEALQALDTAEAEIPDGFGAQALRRVLLTPMNSDRASGEALIAELKNKLMDPALGEIVNRPPQNGYVGLVYLSLGQYDEAIQFFNVALDALIDGCFFHYRAWSKRLSGDYLGAAEDYCKAIECNHEAPISVQGLEILAEMAIISDCEDFLFEHKMNVYPSASVTLNEFVQKKAQNKPELYEKLQLFLNYAFEKIREKQMVQQAASLSIQ